MNEVDEETSNEGEGFGKLLIPGAVIAAIVGAVIFFINSGRNEPKKVGSEPAEIAKERPGLSRGMIELAPASITAPVDFQLVKSSMAEITTELLGKLESIKDEESAERVLPGIKEIATKIEEMGPGLKTLSSNERNKIDELLLEKMKKLNPVIDHLNAIPEIGTSIQPVLEQLRKKLVSYAN